MPDEPAAGQGGDADNLANTELLHAELPDARFTDAAGALDPAYLHWLYDLNPYGPAFQEGVDEDGVRVAHYALVPQRYRRPGGAERFVFSLNAVSRSTAQRKGYFGMLQLRVWSRAWDDGVLGGTAVTNARSHRGVQIMGWRYIDPLPVQVLTPAPVPGLGWQSHHVDPAFLTSPTFAELAQGLNLSPVEHWENDWNPDYLRWRLSSPRGARFAVHATDKLFAVSTRSSFKGVPVAVVCKLLLRHGGEGPVSGASAVTEICRFHRAPAAVYAGFNRHVHVRGLPLPDRFKPSPLNLEFCSLTHDIPQAGFHLDTYEFLDMDAY
jgi:hypothetical protein